MLGLKKNKTIKKLSMKQNFIYNSAYEIFRLIVPLLTTPYISRVLGAEGVGTYSLASTYAQYFILFAGLGFQTYAARELAYVRDDEEKKRQLFWEVFIARLLLLFTASIIYVIVFFYINFKTELSYKVALVYLIASAFDLSYYFKACENFRAVAIRNILVKLFSMILIFGFVKSKDQVWLYVLILAGAELLGQLIMLFSLDKSVLKKTNISLCNMKKHFKVAFSLFIPTIAIQVYTMLDKIMIGEIAGEAEAGYYENSQKMVRLASTLISAIVAVAVPRMSYYFAQNNKDEFKNTINEILRFVSMLTFPMCFGLITIASNFSSWYYGNKFQGIEQLVMLGSLLIISLGWSNIFGNLILIPMRKQKFYTISVYCSCIINILLNVALIPSYGAKGAMFASVVAEFLGMFIMLYFSNKFCNIKNTLLDTWKYLASSLVMGGSIFFLNCFMTYGVFSTCLEIFVGGSIYFLCNIIFKDKFVLEGLAIIWKKINHKRKDFYD